MDLQRYITDNTNYLELFREHSLKVRNKGHLSLISYPYDMDVSCTNPDTNWMRYCRGAIINTHTHKVVCLPPIKGKELLHGEPIDETSSDCEYQPMIDGTMINMFYDNQTKTWILSTRGNIGAMNKWSDKMSFKNMFDMCHTGIDYESLDNTCSYSFVMRHTKNRIISPVEYNEIYLVDVYRYSDSTIVRLQVSDYPPSGFHKPDTCTDVDEFMNIYDRSLPFYIKGFTIKSGGQRYKYLNPNYVYVKRLIPTSNNPYLNYLELRGNGMLRDYLTYFPEYTKEYNSYRDNIHSFTNELYTLYKNVHIYNSTDKTEIPYHMKPLLYDIHGMYLKERNPITWTIMKQYIHDLPPKKLLFALHYEFPQKK